MQEDCLEKSIYGLTQTFPQANIKENSKSLKQVLQQQNVGIVGCLKAIGDGEIGKEDFSLVTKADKQFFNSQFEVISLLVIEFEADFYLYIIPIIQGTKQQIEERLLNCALRLREIDANLPLRANLIHLHYDYPPVKENIERALAEGRQLPPTDEKLVLSLWYKITYHCLDAKFHLEKGVSNCQKTMK